MRRKEQASKRKAVESGALDAEKNGGKAKRQRMWWEEETDGGRGGSGAVGAGGGGSGVDGDEVNDAEYFKQEVRNPAKYLK